VTEDGAFAYKTNTSSEVEIAMKISEIPDKESNQQYIQYVKGLDQENAQLAKLQLTFDTEMMRAKMHALNLCTEELRNEINSFAVNVLKIPIDDFNSNATFVELLNIIDSICHPFWLRQHSEKNTKEMLREMYTKLYNANYMQRKDHQTFSEYFRFMSINFNHLQYIVKLLEDPLLNISEQQYIRELVNKMRSKTNSETFEVHKRVENIQQEIIDYKETLQEQIDDFKMYCKDDDAKIINARNNRSKAQNHRFQRESWRNWRDDNANANRDAAQSLLNETMNEENNETDEHVLISVGELNKIVSDLDIPPEKVAAALKKTSARPNQDKNSHHTNDDNKPYNPTTPGRGGFTPRGGFIPRRGFVPRGGRGTRGRGTYADSSRATSYFNASYFTYHDYDEEEEETNNNLSVQPSKVRRVDDATFKQVPKATAYGAIVEDNGNTSNHIFRHIECFPHGVHEFKPNEVVKVSGQDAGWISPIKHWGIHPIFGFAWYNERGRVNLINPDLLENDGYNRSSYTDENGEFAAIYTKSFMGANVEIEFIKNAEGHLIAMDPWLFGDRMNTPSIDEAESMGNIQLLREFLRDSQQSRYNNYMQNRSRFISEHYQSVRESTWALANTEETSDEDKGRHRPKDDDEQETVDTNAASKDAT
jgi:hypothetical protein